MCKACNNARRVNGYHTRDKLSPLACYKVYQNNAKARDREFSLTLEEFSAFWQKPCHFCNEPISTIGLDRKDNSLGYVVNNVIPCCFQCNFLKGKTSYTEFIGHCAKIARHLTPTQWTQ